MSVASKNLFAILDEEAQEAPSTPAPKQEAASATPSPGNKSQNQRGKGPASRGGRYYQRGGKGSGAAPAAENNEENANSEPRKKRDGDQRGRGRGGRGGARGRGGRGGGRGREFDRHSGTLPDSEKRVHQGWGGDDGDRELQNEQAAVADATGEVSGAVTGDWAGEGAAAGADWADTGKADQTDDWSAQPATTEAAPAGENKESGNENRRRRQQEDEEDDNTVTFDQYLAQKKQTPTELPKLEGIRKANEGSDEALWKNAVHNNGKENEEENYFVGKTKAAPKGKAKKAEKEFIEIEARFERPNRGGRGRGRGGDERRGGRGGRGGNRNTNTNRNTTGAQVDVADEAAFPSLS